MASRASPQGKTLTQAQQKMLEKLDARLNALKCFEYLRELPERDLRALIAKKTTTEAKFKQNELIFGKGDPADALYVLLEGTAAVKETPGGAKTKQFSMANARVFGDTSVLLQIHSESDAASPHTTRAESVYSTSVDTRCAPRVPHCHICTPLPLAQRNVAFGLAGASRC